MVRTRRWVYFASCFQACEHLRAGLGGDISVVLDAAHGGEFMRVLKDHFAGSYGDAVTALAFSFYEGNGSFMDNMIEGIASALEEASALDYISFHCSCPTIHAERLAQALSNLPNLQVLLPLHAFGDDAGMLHLCAALPNFRSLEYLAFYACGWRYENANLLPLAAVLADPFSTERARAVRDCIYERIGLEAWRVVDRYLGGAPPSLRGVSVGQRYAPLETLAAFERIMLQQSRIVIGGEIWGPTLSSDTEENGVKTSMRREIEKRGVDWNSWIY